MIRSTISVEDAMSACKAVKMTNAYFKLLRRTKKGPAGVSAVGEIRPIDCRDWIHSDAVRADWFPGQIPANNNLLRIEMIGYGRF